MKRCPKCGGTHFSVTAHVVQEWIVDKNEEFEMCVNDCVDVAHFPDNEDLWMCVSCGYEDGGDAFEQNELNV